MKNCTHKFSSGAVQLQRVTEFKINQARTLRCNMTPAEKLLWTALRGKKCGGLKFRRQQILDGFIADFFCASHNLVVEVDGSVHDTLKQKQIDEHRRNVFKNRGLYEIRFKNEDVFNNIKMVLCKIIEESEKRLN